MNPLKPDRARLTLDEMLAASAAGAGMLSSQRFTVRSSAVAGSTAIFGLTRSGVVAREIGPFRAGQELVAHIAQFVETDGERITAIETYDCSEPFASA